MNFLPSSFIVLTVFITLAQIDPTDGSKTAKKLIEKLLDKYNTLERPVANESMPIVVSVGLTLMRLIEVNVLDNHIETNIWLNVDWFDENLIWKEEDYENIKSIRIPPHRIWKPDLYVYNQVGELFDNTHPTNVVVKSNGSLSYIPPGIFHTSCVMSVENYPLEEHRCEIKLGSWSHDSFDIDLKIQSDEGDISSFIKNSEWEVTAFPAKKNTKHYACCVEPYVDVSFTLHLKRRGLPILNSACSINFIICSVIILSALLPPSSGHKMTFGMFAMLLCIWAERKYNPIAMGAENPPRLVIYFARLLMVAFISLIGNVITFSTFYKKGSMPSVIKSLLMDKVFPLLKTICPSRGTSDLTSGTEMSDGQRNIGGSDIQDLISRVDDLTKQQNRVMDDWEYFAVVLDRFLFIFWTCFVIIFAIAAFPSLEIN